MLAALLASWAHVRLEYPAADSAGDFLDNARSAPPCGGAILNASRTMLHSSRPFVVRWHLAYAHYGGHTIQIVNTTRIPASECDYAVLANLTSDPLADAATHSQTITIPSGLGCGPLSSCALRLLRSADEWGSGYRFWSCAAIEVSDDVALPSSTEQAAMMTSNECVRDEDCGPRSQASCIDIMGTTAPRKQCFCKAGFRGAGCRLESGLTKMWAAVEDGM